MDLFGNSQTEEEYLTDPDDDGVDIDDVEGYGVDEMPQNSQDIHSPQSSDILLSHQKIEKNLLDLWQANRLPHAMIFSGLKGIGKATLAYRLARYVLKNSDPDNQPGGLLGDDDIRAADSMDINSDDPVFRKVASGGHGDLLTISRPMDEKKGKLKTVIPVEEIRKIAPFLHQTSSEGGWQVVIVDDAQMMGNQAQNALLKILEEPPARVLIILVTHGTGGLLPTIRSRCRFIPFAPLNDDDIQSLLQRAASSSLPSQDLKVLTALSRGSAGQGIALMQQGGIETIHQVLDSLSSIDTVSPMGMDQFALAIGKSGSEDVINQFTYILRWWFETLIEMLAQGQQSKELGQLTLSVPNGHTLHSFLRLHEAVEEHIKMCEHGTLDKRYMVFKALRMIQNGNG